MLKLSFNQKVWSGIAGILILLSLSGINSFWNLNDIEDSNDSVSQTAVPIFTVANEAQIQLLKLANLSANGYNTQTEDEIKPYIQQFRDNASQFDTVLAQLEKIAAGDAELEPLVADIKANYAQYSQDVSAMFEAKLNALSAQAKANEELDILQTMLDDLGQVFADIMNFSPPPEFAKAHLEASGHANQCDMWLQNLTKLLDETRRATDPDAISTFASDALGELENVVFTFGTAESIFKPMDTEGFCPRAYEFADKARERLSASPNFVDLKLAHLELVKGTVDKMNASNVSVRRSVDGLDQLLKKSKTVFDTLQVALNNSVSFGFKSTGIFTTFLLGLALIVFLSMLNAIRRKMSDLAQLNRIGGKLATSRDQQSALDQVLHAMSEKIGVQYGSVYLFNKDQELEARAFLPPMVIPSEKRAITFTMGEGIIGRAAETKKAIFVHDTSKDKQYVDGGSEKPKALLSVPLLDGEVLVGVMNLSGEVSKVSFADSDYEFVATVAHSLVTTIKNIRMVEVIEEHNRDLERKVAERTRELKTKNDDIANMLSNMQQGLFTIVEGGVIHPEYAAYLETIFETPHIAHRNFADLLFSHCDLSTDVKDSAITAVVSIVGEDAMMYEFNSHLLVSECAIQFEGRPDKLIEFDWNPIKDENDIVTKFLVTVRDVTALKALQAEAEAQKQELSVIGEILAVEAGKFSEFIKGSLQFVAECRSIISSTPEKDLARIGDLFRNMHTVKGNARTYGFKLVTEVVHNVENTYDVLRKDEESIWQPEQLLAELALAEAAILRYSSVARDKLGRDENASGASRFDPALVSRLINQITELTVDSVPANVVPIVNDARRLKAALEGKPMGAVIGDVIASVKSLAGELGKAEPRVALTEEGVFIKDEYHGMLNNVFMHLLRNSMDHGIEPPSERTAKGKTPHGTIQIQSIIEPSGVLNVVISDDGRGIAISRIYRKAIENGLYSLEGARPSATEIANLIFASGFSTAEQVTEVSGRGVGMDAVRQFLQGVGGSIDVVLADGPEDADFRSFQVEVRLPGSFFFLTEPLKSAG